MMKPAYPNLDARTLLVALNAADEISRGALCRLALELEVWAGAPDGAATSGLSARLGVPAEPLKKALALRARAAATAAREERQIAERGGRILTLRDEDYPPPLRDLPLPPPVLYCLGEIPRGPALAMVGSRRMNAYGREVAELFAGRLAASGVTIVSGFALGIDTVAHRCAVDRPGGRSVAVLGCGLDVDYPKGNAELGRRLVEHGAIVTEFAMGAPPRRWHFPIRNRVIAALASATLVVQAKLRSGSLITAHHALELGREIYAVPGSIFDELALGTNALIADGALVARTPDDLLESYIGQRELFPAPAATTVAAPVIGTTTVAAPQPGGLAGALLAILEPRVGRTAEDLAATADKPVDRVLAALLELELGGWIERLPGPLFARAA